jgi:hypothetical protein
MYFLKRDYYVRSTAIQLILTSSPVHAAIAVVLEAELEMGIALVCK